MDLEVTPAFPTLIGRMRVPDADAMNQGLLAVFPKRRGEILDGCVQTTPPWPSNSGERQHCAAIRVRKGERQ